MAGEAIFKCTSAAQGGAIAGVTHARLVPSTVYKVDMSTGTVAPYIPDTGHNIVGAGVSTCAPTVIE